MLPHDVLIETITKAVWGYFKRNGKPPTHLSLSKIGKLMLKSAVCTTFRQKEPAEMDNILIYGHRLTVGTDKELDTVQFRLGFPIEDFTVDLTESTSRAII